MTFGPYMPDQPDLGNPGLEVARNVLPRLNGYDSLPELISYGTSKLPSRAMGAHSSKDAANNTYIYAGTASNLWSLVDTNWIDVSRVSPVYSPTTRWEFVTWDQTVIAASLENRLQTITMAGANFADLTTSNVQARHVAAVRSFIVTGYVIDDDGTTPNRVRWSPINNPGGDWTPSPSTLADFQDLKGDGGFVQRIVGGEFGMVFQERSTWRMSFIGAPAVWQFDEVDRGIGAIAPGSVVRHGQRIFFISDDGVHMTMGDASTPIGDEKTDNALMNELDQSHLDRVTSAVATDEHVIVWAYPGPGNMGGQPNRLLLYNHESDRWAQGDEAVDILFQAGSATRSIDGFDDDATYGGTQSPPLYASIDDIPGSLDDRIWSGGAFQLAAIDSTNDLAFYNGPPRDAQFETGEHQLTPGARTFVSECRSLANLPASLMLEIGARNRQQDPVIWSAAQVPNADGIIPFRVNDRYLRWRMTIIGGFADAVGVDVYGEASSGR